MYDQAYAADLGHPGLVERLLARRELLGDCWVFTGCRTRQGYGLISACGKLRQAHRVSAALWLGFDLDSDTCVLHRCDNPPCFNPEHLFFGTNLDNARDRQHKGRYASGSNSPCSRLSEADVTRVKQMLAEGVTQAAIGRRFDVHPSLISRIVRGIRH